MSAEFVCEHCGAPWQSDVSGACRFCRVVAPPNGVPRGVVGARPTIDADALCRLLLSLTADTARPLDRLSGGLMRVAADRVRIVKAGDLAAVSQLSLALEDWQYEVGLEHGDVACRAVHVVRGVVLKRQPLPFDEWLACVAAHLGEYATTHRQVYQAIVALDQGGPS